MQRKMICAGHKLREFTVQIDLLQREQKFTCHTGNTFLASSGIEWNGVPVRVCNQLLALHPLDPPPAALSHS